MPRYRRFVYGMAKAWAVIEEGADAKPKPPPRRRRRRDEPPIAPSSVTRGGVLLGTDDPAPKG